MKLDVYLNFPGHCEEALHFYAEHLGGTITSMMRHGEMPGGGNPNLPPEWRDKILHARMTLGGSVVMAADIPRAETMRSAYLTLSLDTPGEADRVYDILREGGEVFMPMEETFYAYRFAMLRDRFGASWMLLCEREQAG